MSIWRAHLAALRAEYGHANSAESAGAAHKALPAPATGAIGTIDNYAVPEEPDVDAAAKARLVAFYLQAQADVLDVFSHPDPELDEERRIRWG